MNRDEAVEFLAGGPRGVALWNERRRLGDSIPDLSEVDLSDAILNGTRHYSGPDLSHVDLRGVNLRAAYLGGANLTGANLARANFDGAYLNDARMVGASLHEANLMRAHIVNTDLRNANLVGACLKSTTIRDSDLSGANLSRCLWGDTLVSSDLSQVNGLETGRHLGRSDISINSILLFGESLPESFLRSIGITESGISYFQSVAGYPSDYFTCFISYSTIDEEFATRLHNDLRAEGIRCWKWDHDARTGRSLMGEIDTAIQKYEKLILIASEDSLKSPAVNREIERAIQKEDKMLREVANESKGFDVDVLFPVDLDGYIFDKWEHERKVDVLKKVVANARNWTDPKVYKGIRGRLVKDLSTKTPARVKYRFQGTF